MELEDFWIRYSGVIGTMPDNLLNLNNDATITMTSSSGNIIYFFTRTYTYKILSNLLGQQINQWAPAPISSCKVPVSLYLANSALINSLEESHVSDYHIYPNPSSNHFYISSDSNNHGIVEVEILNSLGQLIKTLSWDTNTTQQEVDCSLWNQGVYFIRIGLPQESQVLQFIKH